MQTETSVPATHNLIASDRVEGTMVRGPGGTRIGTIERVMIEKLTGSVAYALLRVDDSVKGNRKYLPISWPLLTYDRSLGAYHLDLIEEELGGAPYLAWDKESGRGDRGSRIGGDREAKSYWGIAENW